MTFRLNHLLPLNENKKKISIRDIFTMGFALFAMFFGAGNVIFPPFLGKESSPEWLPAIIFYVLVDIVISIVAIISMTKNDVDLAGLTGRIGKYPSIILSSTIILCMGPLIALPRCAAVSYDLIMVQLFDFSSDSIARLIFSFFFMLITWLLIVRPTKIVDIVGTILTPLLLIALITLIVKGIIQPDADMRTESLVDNPIQSGMLAGYESMDLFGAVSFGTVMISTAFIKGYKTNNARVKVLSYSSLLAFVLLVSTSVGMAYLGARTSLKFSDVTSQAILVSKIAQDLFSFGHIIVGVLASLACFTTAVGVSSGTSTFFKNFSKKKDKSKIYIAICTVTCCTGFLISNIGLESIVSIAAPILMMVLPTTIVLVILSCFTTKIKSNLVFIFGALGAFISNFATIMLSNFNIDVSQFLPFTDYQLGWVIPAVVGIILGFIFGRGKDDRNKLTPQKLSEQAQRAEEKLELYYKLTRERKVKSRIK